LRVKPARLSLGNPYQPKDRSEVDGRPAVAVWFAGNW
jgi:hypothetical protein